ncbi:MAG TPA: F0F1 ATP synthase subunit gamma [bacterium]|nr:F0F1 ATP synthase subunit gamma [bacterium]
MPAFEQLRRRVRNADELLAVVRTMKVLAAVNIRHYQQAVIALDEYCTTIEQGFQVVLPLLGNQQPPPPDNAGLPAPPAAVAFPVPPAGDGAAAPGRCAAVVFGSDQGLCGQLNRQIAAHARTALAADGIPAGQCLLIAVGARAADCCAAAGWPPQESIPLPATRAGITPLVQELLLLLDDWHTRRKVDRIFLCHHAYQPGNASQPQTVRYLPVDPDWLRELAARPWPSRSLPVIRMDPEQLLAALTREHLFTRLYRACAQSLASEHAARLAAMQRAEKNITEHGRELRRQFHRMRQAAITDELLDIVAGSEALAAAPAG